MGSQGTEAEASEAQWPAHFVDGCPPTNADPLDREIFYLVSTTPPSNADFKSALERGAFPKDPETCQRAGLSCAIERAHLDETRKRVTRLRTYRIASANLKPSHGVYAQTSRDWRHHTMWLRQTALEAAPTLFQDAEGAR